MTIKRNGDALLSTKRPTKPKMKFLKKIKMLDLKILKAFYRLLTWNMLAISLTKNNLTNGSPTTKATQTILITKWIAEVSKIQLTPQYLKRAVLQKLKITKYQTIRFSTCPRQNAMKMTFARVVAQMRLVRKSCFLGSKVRQERHVTENVRGMLLRSL